MARKRRSRIDSGDVIIGLSLVTIASSILVGLVTFAVHNDCRGFYYKPHSPMATACDWAGYNRVPLPIIWASYYQKGR